MKYSIDVNPSYKEAKPKSTESAVIYNYSENTIEIITNTVIGTIRYYMKDYYHGITSRDIEYLEKTIPICINGKKPLRTIAARFIASPYVNTNEEIEQLTNLIIENVTDVIGRGNNPLFN